MVMGPFWPQSADFGEMETVSPRDDMATCGSPKRHRRKPAMPFGMTRATTRSLRGMPPTDQSQPFPEEPIDVNCCAGCFSHPWLRTLVNDEGVPGGSCDYCGAKATTVLDIDQLCEPFRNLMTLYVAAGEAMVLAGLSPGGEPLIDLLQGDYDIFSDPCPKPADAHSRRNGHAEANDP
jgi:hypothetical protein